MFVRSAGWKICHILSAKEGAYFEEGKVDLFSVSIFFFVNTCVEILHIQDDT